MAYELKIVLSTDNAAFEGENLGPEIARILKSYAHAIKEVQDPETTWELESKLRDINGNTVGSVRYESTSDTVYGRPFIPNFDD